MVRFPCCEQMGLKKGPWTPEEDQILISYVEQYGHENWRALPKQAGLLRCGKSCRLRWTNYLRPDIKRGNFSKKEEETIIKLHQILGNRWSAIATRLPGRTDNEIKNYWHTHLKKRVEHDLASPVILRCSEETPIFRTTNQRIPQCCTSSNHLGGVQSNSNNSCFARKVQENIFSLDPCVEQSTQESCLLANGNDAEINGIKTAHELSMTNKSVDAPEYSRVQILSAGQSILQPGDDRINSDMVFWYNLFMDAGRSQESHEKFAQTNDI